MRKFLRFQPGLFIASLLLVLVAACGDMPLVLLTPTPNPNQTNSPNQTTSPALPTATAGVLPGPANVSNKRLGYAELNGPVAKVDGAEITEAEFNHSMDEARATYEEQAGGTMDWTTLQNQDLLKNLRVQTLEGLINFQVVAAQAATENITASPQEVNTRLEDFKKQLGSPENYKNWLARRFATEEDQKKRLAQVIIFEQMSGRHSQVEEKGEQVHVRHILVKTEVEARQMFQRVQQGQDFEALAKQFSLDFGSASKGGDLAWIFRGQTDAAFENAAFALAPNQVSGPVKTDKGYHLIQSLGKEVRPLPLDLIQQRKSEAFSNYIKSLRDKAKIEKLLKL
jgi:parvulin-like peptidyl-prolyl isomerase